MGRRVGDRVGFLVGFEVEDFDGEADGGSVAAKASWIVGITVGEIDGAFE